MDLGLTALLVAFVATFGMIKLLQPFAYLIDLVDKPGGRKHHNGVIPLTGGISVFVGVFIAAYILLEQPLFIRLFMLGGGFLVFLGAIDDRYELSPRLRLIGQILVASVFVYGLNIYLPSFGNLFGFGDVSVGWLGYPLAILSLVGVVNAFNMLDGMDGLIGSMTIISFLGLAFLFGSAGLDNIGLLAILFVGSISAFLIFNIWGKPARDKKIGKTFMGDAGSMFLGLAVGVLVIAGSQGESAAFSPVTALWFVVFPMVDMFTLMYRRVRRGKSPLSPDRTHIHHILMRAGFNSWQSLYILVSVQLTLVASGVLMEINQIPEYLSFISVVTFITAYQLFLRRSWRFIRWNKRRFV